MTGQIKTSLTSRKAIKELFLFSLPIVLGQVGVMLITFGDIFVATKHSTLSVASIGVATGVFNPILLLGVGLMMGVSPSMAIRRGRGEDTHKYLKSSLVYAVGVGIILSSIMFLVNNFVPYMGIEEEMVKPIQRYIYITTWSFPFMYIFQVIKEFLQSFEKVFLPNLISVIGVFVNLGLNYLLVFGYNGHFEYGYDGLAYASFSIRVILALSLLFIARKYLKLGTIDFDFIKSTFKYSLPIACMFFVEVLAFCVVSILAGGMGIEISAANNIVMNMGSITFMIPLSISSAVSVKVGAKFGEKDLKGIKEFAYAALILSLSFMCFSASCFVFLPEFLMKLVTVDEKVIAIGVSLFVIVSLFQLVDGAQVTLSGILRGLEKTKESFIAAFAGYWLLGIPFGILLAYKFDLQASGLWIGLASSLSLVALSLSVIFVKELKRLSQNQ